MPALVLLYRNVGVQPLLATDDLLSVFVLHDARHPVVHDRSQAPRTHGNTSPLQRPVLRLHGRILLPDHSGHPIH